MSMTRYVGVVGPGRASTDEARLAARVGELLAGRGAVVVTGGLGGVMAAAARGCTEADGTSLGLLPGDDRSTGNPHQTLAIPTGLGEMRNALLVRACDAIVAVGTSWGTTSEVALAVRTGVRVVLLGGPRLFAELADLDDSVPPPLSADSPERAVTLALAAPTDAR